MLVCYDPKHQKQISDLLAILAEAYSSLDVQTVSDLVLLGQTLREPLNKIDAVILDLPDGEHLDNLLLLEPLFDGIRTLIILPDRKAETIKKGLRLHPSYYLAKEDSMAGVEAVMTKILGLCHPQLERKADERSANLQR